jgi:hypothetical protein
MYVTFFSLFLISFVIEVYCPGRGGGGGEQCSKKTLPHRRGGGAVL